MFKIDEDLISQRPAVSVHTIGGSGDEPFLKDLENNILADCPSIEYIDNSGMDISFTPSSFLSILLVLAEETDDHQQLIQYLEKVRANSSLTVAFVPVGSSKNRQYRSSVAGNDSNRYQKLQWLEKIRTTVDTLVLLKEDRQEVDTTIVGAVPLLLNGSTCIGIDFADIRYILTGMESERAHGIFIAGSETLTDAENPECNAIRLGTRLLSIAGRPLQCCLGCLDYAKYYKLSLGGAVEVHEKVCNTACINDATSAFSMVVRSDVALCTDSKLMYIAGQLDLTKATLDRIMNHEQSHALCLSSHPHQRTDSRSYETIGAVPDKESTGKTQV